MKDENFETEVQQQEPEIDAPAKEFECQDNDTVSGNDKELDQASLKLDERSAKLDERERMLDCREYIMENGYPKELLDIIDTSNVDEFKKKVEKAKRVFKGYMDSSYKAPPLGSHEPSGITIHRLPEYFENKKHEPKHFPLRDEDLEKYERY